MKFYKSALATGAALPALLFTGAANATSQLDAASLTLIGTDVTDTATALMAWVLPIIGVVLAMIVGLKLLKRFTSSV